jgi:hypothetical protein
MILINLWISWSHVLLSSTCVYYHCQWSWNAKWGSVDISTSTHVNGFWYKQLNCATYHLRYFYNMIFNYFALFIRAALCVQWNELINWSDELNSPKLLYRSLPDLFIFTLFHVSQWFIRPSNSYFIIRQTDSCYALRDIILTVARYVLDQSILIPMDSWITLSVQWIRNSNR